MVSVLWLRLCGEEVAPVTGIKRYAQGSDEKQDGEGSVCESGSRVIPLKEHGKVGWYQQTLKLYDSLTPRLSRFLRHLGLNKDERDDVIQESFLRLAGHLKSGSSDDNLHSWVYRVARNLAMDVHRSNRRDNEEVELEFEPEDEPIDPAANPELAYLQKEQARRLKEGMSRLTAQQRQCVALRLQGLRYREIAEVLGVSEPRVIHLVQRALQRLVGGL
jgi:RNA polymerase sigma-70 factor (ECF subfamily)